MPSEMKTNVEATGPCRLVVKVEVDSAVVDAEYDTVLREFTNVAKVPGFRQGRAPANIVEKRHSKQIVEETRERLLPKWYRNALEAEHIVPVAVVGIHDVSVEKGSGLGFRITVDVAPKVMLPKYVGIELESGKIEIGDKDADDALRRVLEMSAKFEDVHDRPARDGDLVVVDYRAVCEGEPVANLVPDAAVVGEATGFSLLVGGRELVPGLSAGLVGASIGETRDIGVRFPPDYRAKRLAGKTASYSVAVKAIRGKVLPEIDAEFLKRFGADSEDVLRAKIRTDLLETAQREERRRLKGEAAGWLLVHTPLDVPESVVQHETRSIVQDIVAENSSRGVPKKQIEDNRDDILAAAGKTSLERVKIGYILNAIADEEKIAVEEAELDGHLAAMAAGHGIEKDRLRKELEKRDALANIRGSLRAEKALEFVLERARVRVK